MPLSPEEFEQINELSYLDPEDCKELAQDVEAIMDLVEQLRLVNTQNTLPLCHPFDLHQRLRADAVTEDDCLAELAEIAPFFEDDLYLVPKVLESEPS